MTRAARTHSGSNGRDRRLLRHYFEMVVAMMVGMAVLGPLESLLLGPVGWDSVRADARLDALVMATNMTVAMAAWMAFRRHGRSGIALMSAAMFGSFVVLFIPHRAGLLSDRGLMMGGHVLMFVSMAALMAVRPALFLGHHHPDPSPRSEAA